MTIGSPEPTRQARPRRRRGPIRRPEQLAWSVFRGSEALAAGVLSTKQLRGPAWIRVRYDVYADSRLERDHALVCRAAALTLPSYAVIAGRSAAYLLGVDHAGSYADPVEVIVPDSSFFPTRDGLVVHQSNVDSHDVESTVAGLCTGPARTAWDIGAWYDLPTAVSIVDVMLGRGLTSVADLEQFSAREPTVRSRRRAAKVIELADGRSQSPPESRLRVSVIDAGLPRPVPQCPVTVASGVVLHLDLGWPEYRVGLEYDGLWHASADQLNRDRRRLNQLAAAGWIVLHLTGERMRRDFTGLLRELREALRTRGWPG
jgi:hypothetical protein